jgi:hypothetical protein
MSSVPNKNDIIINPKTSRPVKVGSRTWLMLVKEGLVVGHYKDEKKLSEQPDDYEETEQVISKANKALKKEGKQAVRGRGIYKGNIVSRSLMPKTEEVQKHTTKCASKVIKNLKSTFGEYSDDELEKELERLIFQEIANSSTSSACAERPTKTKKVKQVEEQYELKEDDEDEDEDEEDDEGEEYDDDDDE